MITIDQNLKGEILELFQQTFPSHTKTGKLEIYYGDGYAEFPKAYFDSSGSSIEPVFNGWDSAEIKAQSKLTSILSEKVLSSRDGFTKYDKQYWNHFLFICDDNKECSYRFLYLPELDEQAEADTREAIGDELYEKFDQDRKNFKPVEEEKASTPYVDMTKEQLLGYIHQEMGNELDERLINWDSLILKTKIELGEDSVEKSIETYFYYVPVLSSNEVEFESENPIGPMNVVSHIRNKMIEEGNSWNQSTIILFKNGDTDIQISK